MSWQTLPTPDGTATDVPLIVTLGEDPFVFRWLYATRLDRWTLSLTTVGGTSIFTGRHVIPAVDLLRRSRHLAECPPGKLFALSANVQDLTPPTLESLGKTVKLYWNPDG